MKIYLMKYIELYKDIINQEIYKILNNIYNKEIKESIKYILTSPSKRIRAIMCYISYIMYKKQDLKLITKYAISVELFHNALLIYDDIMDKSSMRRGKTTIHKKWNYSRAILSAEYLIMIALKYLHKNLLSNKIIEKFYTTAMMIYEGQQMDINFQKKKIVDLIEYFTMVEYKTSSLFILPLYISFSIQKYNNIIMKEITNIGKNIGILFQLQNDLADIIHTNDKIYAEDILKKKKTILYIKAFNKANNQEKKEILYWYNHKNKNQRIQNILNIFNHLNIIYDVKYEINIYKNKILYGIEHSNIDNKKMLSYIIKNLFMF